MPKSKRSQNKKANPIKRNAKAVTQTVSRTAKKIEPTDVAKGAAAISIAAGMIAAGAALMDKENRKKVGKTAAKGMDFMTEMANEASNRYQSVQMTVQPKKRSSHKQSRGRSKNKG